MSDRNELAKLYAKSKEYLVGKQNKEEERAKITITPLSLDDMNLFDVKKDSSLEEQKEQTLKLIAKSTGLESEDLKQVSIAYLEELFGYIMEANNMKEDEALKKLKTTINKDVD